MSTLVSIIVPLFNRAELIKETIDSILKQSSPHWELIIVDDGSTDGADAIVKSYAEQDKRIRFFYRDREPKGAPTCRNIGVEKSKGDYLIFLDSDDLLAPWCIETRLKAFGQNPQADFLVFPMQFFKKVPGDTDKLWGDSVTIKQNWDDTDNDIDRFISLKTPPPWQTTGPIWNKWAFSKMYGSWKEDIQVKQDVELHVRALAYGLKYRKFGEQHDCFYRSLKIGSISGDLLMKIEKVASWVRVFSLISSYLKQSEMLTQIRRAYLANKFLKIGLDVYGINRNNFKPKDYLLPIKKDKLLPTNRFVFWSLIFNILYISNHLGLNRLGVYLYGNVIRFLRIK